MIVLFGGAVSQPALLLKYFLEVNIELWRMKNEKKKQKQVTVAWNTMGKGYTYQSITD